MTHPLRLAVVPSFLLLCVLAGGASAAGDWANLVLQLIAILILFFVLATRRPTPLSPPSRQAIGLLLLTVAVVAIQLIPLPPALWAALPGRTAVARAFALLQLPLPWLTISLEPFRTMGSALWLLPAVAVFLGVVKLGAYRSSWIAWVLATASVASVVIGALQLVGGEGSAAYIYAITNHGAMTGFFANANHLATLFLVTIPFLAALYLRAVESGRSIKKSSGLLVVLAGTGCVLAVGLAGSGSIAGVGLAVPVVAASTMLVFSRNRKLPAWTGLLVGAVLVGSVAIAFSTPFNNNLTGQRAHSDEDSRLTSFTVTARAAAEYMPFGSGVGTFQQIYRQHEDPASVDRWYMNHTHGDYLELALETGLPGLIVLSLFFVWCGMRTAVLWRTEDADPFARAATIAIGAMLAHSIVDYPLRTAALSAVFAACCALIAAPSSRVRQARSVEASAVARHLAA